jgi:hypothetical protein
LLETVSGFDDKRASVRAGFVYPVKPIIAIKIFTTGRVGTCGPEIFFDAFGPCAILITGRSYFGPNVDNPVCVIISLVYSLS